jgi:hypothetical protein
VRLFTAQFENQFLACSDTSLHNHTFVNNFKEFGKTIVQFRNDFVAEWAGAAIEKGLDRMIESWNEIPTGTIIVTATGPGVGQSIAEMQKRASEALRLTHAYVQEQERIDLNLRKLRNVLQKDLQKMNGDGPECTADERQSFNVALTEINQAVMIGPMPLRPDFCNLLVRVSQTMLAQMDLNEHRDPEMRKASTAMRIAILDQTIIYINRAKQQLESQTSEGQQ